jgi:hypothetical protein
MYMTLDFWILLIFGGISLGIYLACVQHYRELVEVQKLYKEQEALLRYEAERDEHNGWANKETWAFVLMVDNDEVLNAMFNDYMYEQADAFEWVSPLSAEDVNRLGYAVSWWYGRLMEDWYDEQSHMYLFAKMCIGSDERIDWTEVGEWASEKLADYDPHREIA